MPNLYAHYLTAARSLVLIENTELGALLIRHRQAYNLGAQGPDIFFYYRAWPWTPGPRLVWLANLLHKEKVAAFYRAGLAYIRAATGAQQRILTAYLCGYAHHHALDARAHPYIIYKTGDFTLPGAAGQRSGQAHRRFEATIDACLLKRETGQEPPWLRSQNLLDVTPEDARAIGDMYAQVVPQVYGQTVTSTQVQTAISDSQQIVASLLDRGPSPAWLLVQILARLDRSGTVESARPRRCDDDGHHCLNLQHSTWHLPWDYSTLQTTSFLNLMDEAIGDGQRMMMALTAAITRDADGADFSADNRSFDTGLDCSQRVQLRFFDPAVT